MYKKVYLVLKRLYYFVASLKMGSHLMRILRLDDEEVPPIIFP